MSDAGGDPHDWRGRSLVGRDQDVALVRSFVDAAAVRGGSLVIVGDAGVGKSVLIADAAGYAATIGAQVIWAVGIEHDANVSFSGLSQVLSPLLDGLDGLDEGHRSALRGALGLSTSTSAADRMAISNAALQLLIRAAQDGPILLVVDDMPWLDPISAQILAFLARRASGHRLGVLASARTGEPTAFDTSQLRTHELGPLSHDAASALLDSRYPALPPRPRQRLLAEAQGNPLALLELPIALASHGTAALAPVLPLTGRLQQVFAARIAAVPRSTRDALLLAVLDGTGDLAVLGEPPRAAEALAPAVHVLLVTVDVAAAVLTFRHPLIRSAIVGQATEGERRRAHQRLAEHHAENLQRRAWHLAEASTGPNETTAALLQRVAHINLFRGDAVRAISELLRAADLSPDGTDRSPRLAEAAYLGAIVTGDLRDVPALLDAARRADPEHHGSLAGAVAGAYHLLNETGDVDSAHRLLTGAINAVADSADAHNKTLIEALYTLLMVCFFAGRADLWPDFHGAVARLKPRVPRLLSILAGTFSDPARGALPVLDRLDAAIAALPRENSPARIVRTAIAGSYLDRIGHCREPLWRAVRHGREGGAITSAIEALALLGNDAYFAGRWDEVQTLTAECLELCRTHNYRLLRLPGLFLQALVAAARGDDAGRRAVQEMTRWAAPRRVGVVAWYAWHVRTLAALSQGEFDEAYRCATMVSPAGRLAAHTPNALWLIMELVEAAARTGRLADARAHVAAADAARIGDLSPRLALTAAGARAMAADDASFPPLFDRALALPGADRWPFDLARLRLAYGERLRRTRASAAARPHLRAAADLFDQLQARPWSQRAIGELRAAGAHHDHPAATPPSSALTPQQDQIARLAATGLTNKQIGERLFLSARTVGYHLHQIFPKLGVTSRAGLRDALDDRPHRGPVI
ncbi:AAA family ATPase [Dactylosporangium sucinum]|uniref:LuxR family transcriptional regulator n=1 Tax=Dactylosporangium sucinum TaxID=1424081 RepID=A0A917TU99_9ACTN|nr:LuxR family transcriptional regulator [Dactylosporangium sucinum]GGM37716.1 LuxR family transcriptional regulator [Dactylosporangium sucinum]